MFIAFCRLCFWLRGWKLNGELPKIAKYIIVAGPHTSNWDFIYGVAARDLLKTDIKFLGKAQLFKFPFKRFFLKLGGFPVNRAKSENTVDATAKLFAENEHFILALSPEGTRKKADKLKSGFYHIAIQAKVPYVLVGFDYARREFTFSPPIFPSGDLDAEIDKVQDFFTDIKGKHPELGIGN
jgi:1-acyl-sn-glycerol-3-phosphate acyltransferase